VLKTLININENTITIIVIVEVPDMLKFTLEQAMKAQRRSRGIALLFL
jgi:PleD family two-component response regulator